MADSLEHMLPLLAELSRSRDRRRSLSELAREMGRSPSHFQRAFSRIVGESPKQLTRRLQLECAAALLLTSEDSVLQIALDAGFESHEGFTRSFSRHFGRSPKEFRRHAPHLLDRTRHADLLEHVGPCLRLFRTPLERTKTMSYDITTQAIPEVTFLHKTARCTQAEIAKTLGELLPAVFGHATTSGIEMLGPPMTVYTQWGPGVVTLQAGLPVAPGTEAGDDVEVTVLEAGQGAVTIHTGAYDGLGDAHAALEVFIHEQGLERAGPPREIYLTDPGEVPNPDDWKTQIIYPVAE